MGFSVSDPLTKHNSAGSTEANTDETPDLMETGALVTTTTTTTTNTGTKPINNKKGKMALNKHHHHHQDKEEEEEESINMISSSDTTTMSLRKGRSATSKWIFIGLILFLGAAASIAFLVLGIVEAISDSDDIFHQRGMDLTFAVQRSAHDYELFGLWIHQACFKTFARNTDIPLEEDHAGHLGFCSRKEFRRLYDYIASVGVEVQAIEYVPNITHDVRSEVERQSREYYAEHYSNFTYQGITRVVPDQNPGLRVEPEYVQDFYFPLHYIEPFESNEAAIDLNPYSNEARRKAITRAMATWEPAFSDRLKLVQETDPNAYGLGLMHPGAKTPVEDADAPNAFSQIIIRIPALLKRAAQTEDNKNKQVYIYDHTQLDNPIFLGGIDIQPQSGGPMLASIPEVDLREIQQPAKSRYFETRVPVVDRQWTIVSVSTAYEPDLTFIILGGCIIFAACVIVAVWFYSSLARDSKLNAVRSEAEATKSKMALKQAMLERELNEFIAHEVRNPLSSAIAALSFVSSTAKDTEMAAASRKSLLDDIGIIDASLQFINELLRNMLDIHRAADKQMKLELSPTDLLRDVFDPVASILFMRGAKVDIQTDCPRNLLVQSDRMRLKQIVLNLAANSSKFVAQGYIRLRACVVDGSVCIFVEDSGPGIPADKRTRLFAKFQESLDLLNQGTGIGLCVCKNLSELMGADIWLDDTFNSGIKGCPGTRFALRLNQPALDVESSEISFDEDIAASPVQGNGESGTGNDRTKDAASGSNTTTDAKPIHISHRRKEEALPESMSVLFVDDDTIVRKMFTRALSRIAPQWSIQEASNGETALRLVESENFDVIFVDQYMASIEKQLLGTETVRAMRVRGIQCTICGLSANDTEAQFLECGANAFMFKPFPCEKNALKQEVLRVLHAGEKCRIAAAAAAAASANNNSSQVISDDMA